MTRLRLFLGVIAYSFSGAFTITCVQWHTPLYVALPLCLASTLPGFLLLLPFFRYVRGR